MDKDTVWGYEQEKPPSGMQDIFGTEPEQTGKQTENIESTVRKKTDDKLRKEKGEVRWKRKLFRIKIRHKRQHRRRMSVAASAATRQKNAHRRSTAT